MIDRGMVEHGPRERGKVQQDTEEMPASCEQWSNEQRRLQGFDKQNLSFEASLKISNDSVDVFLSSRFIGRFR